LAQYAFQGGRAAGVGGSTFPVKKWERKLATEASAVHLSVFSHRRWEAKPFISGPDEHLLETHIEPEPKPKSK
jgi:hypothetical protein